MRQSQLVEPQGNVHMHTVLSSIALPLPVYVGKGGILRPGLDLESC